MRKTTNKAEQQGAQRGSDRPDRDARPVDVQAKRLAPPVRRKILRDLGADPPQGLVEIALDLLQGSQAPGLGAIDALEAKRQAGVVQFEHRVIDQRIEFGVIEQLEEAHAADALAEEAAEHAVLRPDMTVFGGNVLDDVVGGSAEDVFGVVCLLLGNAG